MKIKLNLIPETKKEEIKKRKSFRFLLKQGVEILVLILFLSTSVLSFQWVLGMEKKSAEDSLNYDSRKKEFDKIKNLDEKFKGANELINDYEKIQKDQLNWSYFLEEISLAIPDNIFLNGIISKNFSIILSGNSVERKTLIEFKENLEKNECFENVNLPLSNLVSRNNIDFQIEFDFKNNCLKQK